MTQELNPRTEWYLASFEQFEKSLNGESRAGVHETRREAIRKFAELGFPTTHDEEWKYTDVSPIARLQFGPAPEAAAAGVVTPADIARFSFGIPHLLVLVNGRMSASLSRLSGLPAGVRAGSLAAAIRENAPQVAKHLGRHARYDRNGFLALSAAFLRDGAFIDIGEKTILREPIHVISVATGDAGPFVSYPRTLIVAGANSQSAILESHVCLGANTYFTNTVTEIAVGENAVLEHDKLQLESPGAFHVGAVSVRQERDSNFTQHAITMGGLLTRNDITALLAGPGIESTINGLYLATGKQHIDSHTAIDHAQPNCNSHELYKGILSGQSRGVFNGKIFVRKDAQKTDAKQTNNNLVLSDEATIDTKPQLEIFANDVKCTHGATIGQIDDEAVFYLRSRGVGYAMARDILIFAFASDVLDRLKIAPVREHLRGMIHERLEREPGRRVPAFADQDV